MSMIRAAENWHEACNRKLVWRRQSRRRTKTIAQRRAGSKAAEPGSTMVRDRGFFRLIQGNAMNSMGVRARRYAGAALLILGIGGSLPAGPAEAQTTLKGALGGGVPIIDLRLRYEAVDQANKPKNAAAATIRARLGYQTGQYFGFSALADFDFVQHLGPKHYFDSIGGGAAALYPAIADPDMATLNRLQLTYAMRLTDTSAANAPPDLRLTIGRQRIIFADARFIGNVGWRQHEQTFDGVSLVDTSLPATTFTYAYITRVNRVFGPNSPAGRYDSHSHFINVVYGGLAPYLKLEGYAYLLDLRQAPTLSSATYGGRGDGSFDLGDGFTALLNGQYAHQTDFAKNPLDIDLNYYLGETGLAYHGATGLVGYEVLQGNGTMAFQTPLATLHAFQGWAETFLTKPPNGIRDLYVKGSYGFAAAPFSDKITATLVYHDFSPEHVSGDYGSEWDAMVEAQLDSNFMVGTAYANYRGAGPFPDKAVFWLYAGYRY
jgi:hypothetical protein